MEKPSCKKHDRLVCDECEKGYYNFLRDRLGTRKIISQMVKTRSAAFAHYEKLAQTEFFNVNVNTNWAGY